MLLYSRAHKNFEWGSKKFIELQTILQGGRPHLPPHYRFTEIYNGRFTADVLQRLQTTAVLQSLTL